MSKLTKKDLDTISYVHQWNPAYHWLRVKDQSNFEIGDVLVKMRSNFDYKTTKTTYNKELISNKTKIPRRYKVIHIDEYQVPFVKVMKANGELGTELICLATFDPASYFFTVDPDYAEHLILSDNAEYDITSQIKEGKKHRLEIRRHNRKLRQKSETLEEAHEFIKTLKKGDKLWIGSNGNDDTSHENECVVKSTKDIGPQEYRSFGIYDREKQKILNNKNTWIAALDSKKWGSNFHLTFDHLMNNYYIYLEKPKAYDKELK